MDQDSEGQKNQGILVGEGVMIDWILATIVGLILVVLLAAIPLLTIMGVLKMIEEDMEEKNNFNEQ